MVVGLLPGSRAHEVDILGPLLLDAARRLLSRRGDLRFLLPVAEPLYADRISRAIEARGLSEKVRPVTGSQDAMRAADLLLTASGTATLEAALLGVPMVVVYKVSAVTQTVVRTAIRLGLMESDTCALPNLVLGFPAVPELKQKDLDARSVESAAWELIVDEGRRDAMRQALLGVNERLTSQGTIGQVCSLVLARAALSATRKAQARAVCPGPAVRDPLKDGN
jgi:lipid-A-disaccharide synthase